MFPSAAVDGRMLHGEAAENSTLRCAPGGGSSKRLAVQAADQKSCRGGGCQKQAQHTAAGSGCDLFSHHANCSVQHSASGTARVWPTMPHMTKGQAPGGHAKWTHSAAASVVTACCHLISPSKKPQYCESKSCSQVPLRLQLACPEPAVDSPVKKAGGVGKPEGCLSGVQKEQPEASCISQVERTDDGMVPERHGHQLAAGTQTALEEPDLEDLMRLPPSADGDSPVELWQSPAFGRSSLDAVMQHPDPMDSLLQAACDAPVMLSTTSEHSILADCMPATAGSNAIHAPALVLPAGAVDAHQMDPSRSPRTSFAMAQPTLQQTWLPTTVCSSRDPPLASQPYLSESCQPQAAPTPNCSALPMTAVGLISVAASQRPAQAQEPSGRLSNPCGPRQIAGCAHLSADIGVAAQPSSSTWSQQDNSLSSLFGGLSPLTEGGSPTECMEEVTCLSNPPSVPSGGCSQNWLQVMENVHPGYPHDLFPAFNNSGGPCKPLDTPCDPINCQMAVQQSPTHPAGMMDPWMCRLLVWQRAFKIADCWVGPCPWCLAQTTSGAGL